ncbi:unnamed protein product [Arabis nemorensis]|uniref:Uncharacterized protein n=1 Tax=Arabis nemorensis TaxID=586526 RepID=A0A565C5R6_9BRAS|nr:unnamed protein product [Arabis nemorensis]
MAQKTENASKEDLDNGGRDISLLNQSNGFEDVSHTKGNHGNDAAPKEDVDDDDSTLVSNDGAINVSSLN